MSLYLKLLLISVAIPVMLSFDQKLAFYKKWKVVFPSIILVAILFIIPDIMLTTKGVWGFNSAYHSNFTFLKLPLEEWLFFLVIPYASLFAHYAFILYFPSIKLPQNIARYISIGIVVLNFLVIFFNSDKTYTVYILSLLNLVILFSLFDKTDSSSKFYVTYVLVLIPFILVNATLTGTFIENEIVWYDNNENLGIRLLTIPIEDFAYAFSLVFLNILCIDNYSLIRNKANV